MIVIEGLEDEPTKRRGRKKKVVMKSRTKAKYVFDRLYFSFLCFIVLLVVSKSMMSGRMRKITSSYALRIVNS